MVFTLPNKTILKVNSDVYCFTIEIINTRTATIRKMRLQNKLGFQNTILLILRYEYEIIKAVNFNLSPHQLDNVKISSPDLLY